MATESNPFAWNKTKIDFDFDLVCSIWKMQNHANSHHLTPGCRLSTAWIKLKRQYSIVLSKYIVTMNLCVAFATGFSFEVPEFSIFPEISKHFVVSAHITNTDVLKIEAFRQSSKMLQQTETNRQTEPEYGSRYSAMITNTCKFQMQNES